MGFIPARCTQCGAEIKVDASKDAGICEHCGTAFVTEKAINNYNTYVTNDYAGATINVVSGDIQNLIHLAWSALWADKPQEAYDYANKALEIDTGISEPWMIKLKAASAMIDYKNIVGDPAAELVSYGTSAICYLNGLQLTDDGEYAEEQPPEVDKEMESVYTTYLLAALGLINEAVFMTDDTTDMFNSILQGADKELVAIEDKATRTDIERLTYWAMALMNDIPVPFIDKHPAMQDIVKTIVEQYISFCHADSCRMHLYDKELPDYIIAQRKDIQSKLTKGLGEKAVTETKELEQKVDTFIAESNAALTTPPKKEGCYIATAVYGSYDAPEVLVLRHFRDSVLSPHSLGKLFVKCYYAVSPVLVKYLSDNHRFISISRIILDKLIRRLKK